MSEADADDRLAERCRKGDPRALAALYCRHAPSVLRFLRARGLARDDAEDILQETFVRLLEGRGMYHERGRFRSWLLTIAARLAIDGVRRRARRAALDVRRAVAAAAHPPEDALETVARSTLAMRVDAAIAVLSPEQRAAFEMRVRERLTYREMAVISGDPEGTLRSRVHHAIRRLQETLGDELDTPAATPRANETCSDNERT